MSMVNFFWSVIALVLVVEGFLPALCPDCWRRMARAFSEQSDKILRIAGLVLMALGAIILVLVHHTI